MSISDSIIEQFTEDQGAHYEPYGWHHWPAYPWMAYQFRRALGETQEGEARSASASRPRAAWCRAIGRVGTAHG